MVGQNCSSISINSIEKVDHVFAIEEDSNGDFYFSDNSEKTIINNSTISVQFSEKRFLENYDFQVFNDNKVVKINNLSIYEVCGDIIQLRIVLGEKIIQEKQLKLN